MMVLKSGLRYCVIFIEGGVVSVVMATTVGTNVWLEGGLDQVNFDTSELLEHCAQNRVRLKLQIAGLQLQSNMAITKMIGGSKQSMGMPRKDPIKRLISRDNLYRLVVIGT
jgi:hypothetical protein